MAENDSEKTQDPTPHRRQQAREEGQIAQSPDLASAGLLIAGLVILLMLGGQVAQFFARLATQQLGGEAWLVADDGFIVSQWHSVLADLGQAFAPIMGLLLLAGILVHLLQTGLLWVPDKLALDLSRLDPIAGFKRMFSLTNAVRLAMGLLKVLFVSLVAFWSLYHRREEIIGVAALSLPQIATFIVDVLLWTCLKIAFGLLVLAIIDYGYQRWNHERDLKMTQQEVRDEMKNLQGNPQVISRRRQVQRQLALHRISSAVPKADVVITNPTELAIAIQYEPATMNAPIVLAKGAGVVAARIRRLALENGVPVLERKPLAQALYKEVDINRPIPDKMYAAVAELLAYVYQLKGKPLPTRPA
ncbi:MAG TPA: flagellar biosynthesis protein FlhB [Pirellulales bacterium]|jgi:flagellar biosynthetic protein FlhB